LASEWGFESQAFWDDNVLSSFAKEGQMIVVKVFWVVMPCSVALQACICFPFPSIIHFTLKMKAARYSETLVSSYNTTLCQKTSNLHHCENL
jgi:hypothetical protein